MKIKTCLLLLLLMSKFFNCIAQAPSQMLDIKLAKIYKSSNFPGFAVTIIRGDSSLFANSYGYANKAKKLPYTLETIQPIGSVSKTFIALALMKAIELGYFNLETNINDLLPFTIINPNFPKGIITLRNLATHTSSLIDNETIYYSKAYQLNTKPTIELGVFLKDYFTKNGQYYSPQNFDTLKIGTNYSYSNIASALVAYIIEIKSKMPFSIFTNKYIFEPLKMYNTDWFYNESIEKKYAKLYQVNKTESVLEEKLINDDNTLKTYSCVTYPDGSLKTTINDLTLFVKAMMKGFFANDSIIIGKQLYHNLFEKQFTQLTMPTNMDKREPNRAIFWSYSKKGDIRHTGSDPGVFAFVSFNPITKIGRVMTINTSLEGGENVKTVEYFKKVIAELDKFEESIK